MKKIRIDKLISNMGIGTRRKVKKIIKDKQVKINDKIITDPSLHVNPDQDEIYISGEKLRYEKNIFVMLNKPAGVITATEGSQKTVLDLLDTKYKIMKLFPIGRLDKDTVGLLVLTNDGQAAHNILKPNKHVPKTYYVRVEGKVTEKNIHEFKEGVFLEDGYKTMPSDLKIIETDNKISKVELRIYEGKFHQVKRMFESLGMKVVYLKRIKMGYLSLDSSLKEGEYREMNKDEIEKLMCNVEEK